MAAKVSLAEKYALRLTHANSAFELDKSLNCVRPQSPPEPRARTNSTRILLAEKYEAQNHSKEKATSVPGSFGLPIKKVLLLSLYSNELDATPLYKTMSTPRIYTPKRLFSQKSDRHYKVGKNHATGARMGKLARRIAGFLASLGSTRAAKKTESGSWRLSGNHGSIGRALPQTAGTQPRFHTLPSRLANAPSFSGMAEETDEVDLTIRENRHKQEKRQLERQLEIKQKLTEDIKEDYERRLYIQEKDFEARLHALREELAFLKTAKAKSEAATIEQSEARPETVSASTQQKFMLADLEERSKRLEEKEVLLAAREFDFAQRLQKLKQSKSQRQPEAQHFVAYRQYTGSENSYSLDFERPKLQRSALSEAEPSGSPQETLMISLPKRGGDKTIFMLDEDLETAIQAISNTTVLHESEKKDLLRKLRYCVTELKDESILKKSNKVAKLSHIRRFLDDFEECRASDRKEAETLYSHKKLDGMRLSLESTREFYEEKARTKLRLVRKARRQLERSGNPAYLSTHEQVVKYIQALSQKAVAVTRYRELILAQREVNKVIKIVEAIDQKVNAEPEKETSPS